MGEEPARGAGDCPVLRLTERIHQRQFGAVVNAGRIHERLCFEGWLERMAGPWVSDGAEIGAFDSAQMKRGGRMRAPFSIAYFFAGQKYGVGRVATRWFWFCF